MAQTTNILPGLGVEIDDKVDAAGSEWIRAQELGEVEMQMEMHSIDLAGR